MASSFASSAAQASPAATACTSSASAAAALTKVGGAAPSTSSQQASKARAHRAVWKPHARKPLMPVSSSVATSSGSMRMPMGSQNGVWLNHTARRSGRFSRRRAPTSERWKSCTSTTAPSGAASAVASAKAMLTER